jgi:hypothetical protein
MEKHMKQQTSWMKILASLSFLIAGWAFATPSAITYLDDLNNQRIYVFDRQSTGLTTGTLIVNYSEGFDWQWADMGRPPGTTGIIAPNAITYLDTSGNQQIHAFARWSPDLRHLFSLYFDGFDWYWADRG